MFKIKDAWQIVENTEGIQTFTDVDGQQYRYKRFGTQIWMLDNYNRGGLEGEFTTDHNTLKYNSDPVKTVRYKDVLDYQNWNSEYGLNRGAIYRYGDSTYGFVTDLIPSGWHIATQSDWETLISWANTEYPGFGLQALMAKTTFWCPQNPSSSVIYDNYDKSGFGIVPAGRLERSNNAWQYSDSAANSKAYFIIGDKSVILIEQAQNSAPAYSFPGNYSNWTWGSVRLVKDGGLPPAQPIITDIVTSLDSTGSDNKLATEKATRSAIASAVSSKMSNPMTTAGDLIVGGTSGAPSRLASGTQGQVLKVGSSGLEWGNESSGMQNPMTTSGDIIVGGNSGAPGRLGQGIYGQVLKVGSSGLEWGNEIGFENPMTGRGDLIVGTSGGVPGRLGPGNDGQILTSRYDSGVYYLQWATIPTQTGDHKILVTATDTEANYLASKLTPGSNITITTNTDSDGKQTIEIASTASGMINPMTSAGDIIVGGSSGTPARLAIGTQGQVLKVGASGLEWGNETGGMVNPMTTAGDIITGGASGAAGRLGIGTSGQVLTVGLSGPEWASIPTQTGDHKVSTDGTDAAGYLEDKIDAGTNVSITKSSGKIVISSTDTGMLNPMTTAGDIIVGGSSGTPDRLGKASSDCLSVLASSNTANTSWQSIDQDILGFDPSTDNHTMFYMDKTVVQTRAGEPEQLTYKGEFRKIATGTTGQVLKLNGSGVPAWGDGLDNIITTSGDLVVGGAHGTPERLAHGDAGQVLVSSSGSILWSDIVIPLGGDKQSPGEIFYTMNEDEQTRAGGLTEYSIKLKRLPAGTTGNILSLEESTYNGGLDTQYIPYWRTESDVFLSGHPMTAFGDIMYAGAIGAGGARNVLSLPAGTLGQVLGLEAISTFGMKPKWIDLDVPIIETFPLSLVNNCQPTGTFDNNMNLTKTYSPSNKKVTKMGFFHKSGTRGTMGLGIYSASGTLLASTAMSVVTSATEGHICWIDLETPITLEKGVDYWFGMVRSFNGNPDWSSNINFGHNTTITGCTNSISIQYYLSAQPVTTMPSTITATQEGAAAIWIVAD